MAQYEIITTRNGETTKHLVTDLFTAIASLGLTVTGVETRAALRPHLRGLPRLSGFVGPCHGGERQGETVVRYEDAATYKAMGA